MIRCVPSVPILPGKWLREYYEGGLAVVNGHAYKSQDYKTSNTNFALLVSKNFTKPFSTPIEYGRKIAELSICSAEERSWYRTFGDFRRGEGQRKNGFAETI